MILLAVTLAALAGPSAPARPVAAPRSTAVGIGLTEWQVTLGRPRVPAGRLRFNVTNLGEDGHDFVMRTRDGAIVTRLPELAAGARRTATVKVRRPGRYVLFCDLPRHEARGMKARLTVARSAQPKRAG